jgi:hypothetical protein
MGSIRPTIDHPDLSTEVVGALSMADLGPFGRSPLRLLFVVAAAVVAIGRGALIAGDLGIGGPLDVAAFAGVSAATETLVVLLPVALLLRVPAAPQTHLMLLGGLALGALVEVLRLGSAIVPASLADPSVGSILRTFAWLGVPFGSLLVGLGLLRLRAGRTTRRGMLVVIAFLYLVLSLLPLGAELIGKAPVNVTWLFLVSGVLVPILAAFAGWVAVDAWLDGERPNLFWGLLAVAVPLHVVGAFFSAALPLPALLALPASPAALNSLAMASATLGAILALVVVTLGFVAYARKTPSPAEEAPD